MSWLYTSSGGEGYVNQDYGPGGDRRIGGLVGIVLAFVQRTFSFHSSTPPFSLVWRPGKWKLGVEFSRPGFAPFLLIFIPRKERMRWRSFRIGWRWDANWGNAQSPDHAKFVRKGWAPGGYILDVIIKSRINNLVE